MTLLEQLGSMGYFTASAKAAGVTGQNSITVNIGNGPTKVNKVWIVDSAYMNYTAAADAGVSIIDSGLCVCSNTAPAIADKTGVTDVADRGVLFMNQFTASIGIALPVIVGSIVSMLKVVIPYGYTLRAVWANDPAVPANFPTGLLSLAAMIREVDVC